MHACMEQKTAGTIMTAVSRRDFENIMIPTIPKERQRKISNLVARSFELRRESNRLIQEATSGVEDFIESSTVVNRLS